MVKWSDFVRPEYAPIAYGLRAAMLGGSLGWLYDKMRGKKHTARRIGIGALIGLLGGAGYGQHKLNSHISEQRNRISEVEDENRRLGVNLRTSNRLLNELPHDCVYKSWDRPNRDGEGDRWDHVLKPLELEEKVYVESLRRIAKKVNEIRDEYNRLQR